jgi:hypothetical protein
VLGAWLLRTGALVAAHRKTVRRPFLRLGVTTAVVVGLAGAGVAVASIPDAGTGTIHACYVKTGGALRVIDVAKGQKCKATETAISWPQQSGLGARSYNGQIAQNFIRKTVVTTADGLQLVVDCDNGAQDWVVMSPTPGAAGFWGWGTESQGDAPQPVNVLNVNGQPSYLSGTIVSGNTQASVVATFSGHYTRFDISLVLGTMCNYHVMVTTSS